MMESVDPTAQANAPPDVRSLTNAELLALHDRCSTELGVRGMREATKTAAEDKEASGSRRTHLPRGLRKSDLWELESLLDGETDPVIVKSVTDAFIRRKQGDRQRARELASA